MLDLVGEATAADGVRPLSEAAELRLQHGGPPGGSDLVLRGDDGLVWGYARLDLDSDDGEAELELVVRPGRRRQGLGTELAAHAEELAGARSLRAWAHGDLPGSAELAARRGYRQVRVLLQMRRSLAGVDAAPRPPLPAEVHVAPFRPGRDEAAWLSVNARAFAAHPEQGRWTDKDLRLRTKEPWFDPTGFLLAWKGDPNRGGTLLGSHWTKVHPPGDGADEALGEVYVLGVDPAAQGLGLGRALTDLGLAHLRARGVAQVLLYVEEDNAAAVALYERSGFTRHSVDVAWRRAGGVTGRGAVGRTPGRAEAAG